MQRGGKLRTRGRNECVRKGKERGMQRAGKRRTRASSAQRRTATTDSAWAIRARDHGSYILKGVIRPPKRKSGEEDDFGEDLLPN